MLTHGDKSRKASEGVNSENAVTQHRIKLAKSILLITLAEIAGGRNTMTVINTVTHPREPVFTREAA